MQVKTKKTFFFILGSTMITLFLRISIHDEKSKFM